MIDEKLFKEATRNSLNEVKTILTSVDKETNNLEFVSLEGNTPIECQ